MKSEFKQFQKVFTAYQKEFGLNGYRAYFKQAELTDAFADITINSECHVVTVRLNEGETPAERHVEQSAKHEALHLLIGRLESMARRRYTTEYEIDAASEELVFKLEQLIPDIKGIQ